MVMLAEAIARVAGSESTTERLKDLTRGQRVDAARMQEFVQSLGLSAEAEARLLALTPGKYTGIADQLVAPLKYVRRRCRALRPGTAFVSGGARKAAVPPQAARPANLFRR